MSHIHSINVGEAPLAAAYRKILSQYEFNPKLQRFTTKYKNIKVYCINCETDYPVKYYFALHLIECFHNEDFICPFCCRKKSCIADLTQHIRNHFFTLKPHSCNKCDFKFLNEWNLESHKGRFHSGYMPKSRKDLTCNRVVEMDTSPQDSSTVVSNVVMLSQNITMPQLTVLPQNIALNNVVKVQNVGTSNMILLTSNAASPTVNINQNIALSNTDVPNNNEQHSSKGTKPKKVPEFISGLLSPNDHSAAIMQASIAATSEKKVEEIPASNSDNLVEVKEGLKQRLVYKDGNKVCILSMKDSEILKKKISSQRQNSSEKFSIMLNSETKQMKIVKVMPLPPKEPVEQNCLYKGPGFNVLSSGEVQSTTSQRSVVPKKSNPSTIYDEYEVEPRKRLRSKEKYACTKCGLMVLGRDYFDHLYCHVYKCSFCTMLLCSKEKLDGHFGFRLGDLSSKFEYNASVSLLQEVNPWYLDTGKDRGGQPYYFNSKETNNENYTCQVCQLKLKFHCQLIRHQMTSRHDINLYQCATCLRKYSSIPLFQIHTNSHENEHTRCQCCKKVFIDLRTFLRHLYSFHAPGTYGMKCQYCLDMKLNDAKLKKHIEKNHKDKNYVCTQCDMSFIKKIDFDVHLNEQHDIEKYICPLCNAQFSNKAFEIQHKESCNCKKTIVKTTPT